MTTAALRVPSFDLDFWSDDVVLNSWPHYAALREAGAVVRLAKNDAWAITRHAELKAALASPEVFISGRGVMMNDPMNAAFTGNILCTDDPEHQEMRRVFARPLMPSAIGKLRPRMEALAVARVAELAARGTFDAVRDLAHLLPLAVVAELVGLPEEGRRHMLDWAGATFDAFGPLTSPRTVSALEITKEAAAYTKGIDPATLTPGSWGALIFEAAAKGEIAERQARSMMMGYVAPALDTTINAVSSAVALFARNPDAWDRLRADPSLIPSAINEVLRMDAPIRAFARELSRDHELGGVTMRAGERVQMLYACANRDPRAYPEPDRFDIARNPRDQLSFGHGVHACAGMHLARLEIAVLLEALIPRIARFHIREEHSVPHNTLHGLHRLIVGVDAVP